MVTLLRAALPLAAMLLLPATPLLAVNIFPGNDTTFLPNGAIPNATLLDTAEHPFDFTGTITIPGQGASTNPYSFQGFLRELVYREDASGLLDFQYQFVVTTRTNSGPQAITFFPGFIRNFTLNNFPATISVDAFTTSSAGTNFTPTTADRLDPPNLNFTNFTTTTTPITTDPLLSGSFAVRTNATSYDANGTGVITFAVATSGGIDQTESLFRPLAAAPGVPEPTSLALLPLALTALTLRLRKRS
jgi:hypothetical protein